MASFLENLFGLGAGDATMQAAGENYGEINRYGDRANNAMDTGVARSRPYLESALSQYAPLSGATGMYSDALGLGGAEGTARAKGSFSTTPGFEFSRDQGIQAIDRSRSARGSFQSGGAEADVMDYATGRANQEYGGWLDRLMGASNTALSGQGNAMGNLANFYTGDADKRVALQGDLTTSRVNNNNMYAQGGEANAAGIANLGGNLASLAGRAFGYGGF